MEYFAVMIAHAQTQEKGMLFRRQDEQSPIPSSHSIVKHSKNSSKLT
jgi:hypothetical protein